MTYYYAVLTFFYNCYAKVNCHFGKHAPYEINCFGDFYKHGVVNTECWYCNKHLSSRPVGQKEIEQIKEYNEILAKQKRLYDEAGKERENNLKIKNAIKLYKQLKEKRRYIYK